MISSRNRLRLISGLCSLPLLTHAQTNLTILAQPQNQQTFIGGNATLTVAAEGPPPLSYQWVFGGTNLPDGTTSALQLVDVQPEQAGSYSVVVTSPRGSLTSAPAFLFVSPYQVRAWGTNYFWGSQVPTNLDLVAISVGAYFTGLRSDGTVVAWGLYGALQPLPPGLTNLIAISSKGAFNVGLRADGSVVDWNAFTSVPSTAPSELTNVLAVAAGEDHGLALTADGRVVGWGDDTYGQTDVPSDLTNVVGIAAGSRHSLALTGDGAVVGWGEDVYGQADAPADLTNAVAIAVGDYHNVALRADGTVSCWGRGWSGETVPPPGLSNAVAIAAGFQFSLALMPDSTVIAWGDSGRAQSSVPSDLTNVVAIAAGAECSMALLGSGPPFLTSQMINRTVTQGAAANLRASAAGSRPLNYQWCFNHGAIPGATNTVLCLPNIQPDQAGAYSVIVANARGLVASRGQALVRVASTRTDTSSPSFIPGSLSPCSNGAAFQLALAAPVGANIEIQFSTNLQTWSSLGTFKSASATTAFTDSHPVLTQRFYRARIVP
jgi:Regulator of chromosome condensation (RCC1) repeat/Immunoglobulin domain